MTELEDIEAVARAAVHAGGAELRQRYRAGDTDADFRAHDVKAAADEAAEGRMLPVVRRAFPDHSVFAEESGHVEGSEDYHWVIDPLDGTNNFAIGLPTFASSIAVLHRDEPVVAAVHLPMTDETYLARRDGGVTYNGRLVDVESDIPLEAATVLFVTGRAVAGDPALARRAEAIRRDLYRIVKRPIVTWAPTVHAGLVARGRIQGLVQFHPDEEERAATELLVTEAGAATRRKDPMLVAARDDPTVSAIAAAIEETG